MRCHKPDPRDTQAVTERPTGKKRSLDERNDNKNVSALRKDDYAPRERPILADILSGVQGEVSACGNDHAKVPKMQEELYIRVVSSALAEVLPGMS